MIIKNEVKLHQNSIDYAKKTFGMYQLTDELDSSIKDPILHMYPVEDTYDEEGDLIGYSDALFFRIDVYNTQNMTVYKGNKLHDGILPFRDINVSQLKIFKDLSTMVVLKGDYVISVSHQAVDIYEAKVYQELFKFKSK
jgi:hypothetical protein